ncbi:MAG: 2OG-Fe(II) oxygenase [Burkholderiales bacterium]
MLDISRGRLQLISTALAGPGWCVVPCAIAASEVEQLRARACELWQAGAFSAGGTGRKRVANPAVRADAICWVDAGNPVVSGLLAGFETLRLALNQQLFLGLFDFEAHFTRYAALAHYSRHVDRFSDSSSRAVSCVLYLNDSWQPCDGGQLRMYPGGEPERCVDVWPEGGTLVIFLSERIYHEVLPATRERWSFTGWFKVRG